MRALQNLLFCTLAILYLGVAAFSQDPSASIDGPILGFLEGSTRTTIHPIHGVLGASAVAQPLLPTGFRPLKGTSVFRLSDPADGPVAVLDASSAEPRIIILPVASAVIASTAEEVQPR
jgi:hypothetical protein